nr:hypothetical protein [Anaerolineae bacterium]
MTGNLALSNMLNRSFVVARGEESLREALLRLKTEGGQEWWYLVVDIGERYRFLAARFSDLRSRIESEGAAVLDMPLKQVGEPLLKTDIVDLGTGLAYAEKLAGENQSGIVIVVKLVDIPPDTRVETARLRPFTVVGLISVLGTRDVLDFNLKSLVRMAEEIPFVKEPVEEGDDNHITTPITPDHLLADVDEISKAYQEIVTPPGISTQPAETDKDRDIDVSIDGDVTDGGDVYVAGHDIVVMSPERPKEYGERRFEAAFPHEVYIQEEYRVWVAVLLPDAKSPFSEEEAALLSEGSAEESVPVAFDVDPRLGDLLPVEVDVSVTGEGFEIVGTNQKPLTVWPDGRTTRRWFMVRTEESGTNSLYFEISQEGRLLYEFAVQATAFKQQTKLASLLNRKLKITSVKLSFAFAPGVG